jgi:hypothetical protein
MVGKRIHLKRLYPILHSSSGVLASVTTVRRALGVAAAREDQIINAFSALAVGIRRVVNPGETPAGLRSSNHWWSS